jgi:hypothetical protein
MGTYLSILPAQPGPAENLSEGRRSGWIAAAQDRESCPGPILERHGYKPEDVERLIHETRKLKSPAEAAAR